MKRCARCAAFYEDEHVCRDLVLKSAVNGPKSECVANVVANNPMVANAMVANAPRLVANRSGGRHGKYRDVERRRAYMAAYMRKWRSRKTAGRILAKASAFDSPEA